MNWDLAKLLDNLHTDIEHRLKTVRSSFGHPDATGDGSEAVWLEMLRGYLPQRYQAEKAYVVDSNGHFSDQIDVVVFDRQYSPFIFRYEGQTIVPAESVYAVFEAKQEIDARYVRYAQEKAMSVRRLDRTSLPIPHAGGTYPAKPLIPILSGILTFESGWSPCFGAPFEKALMSADRGGFLTLGCVAAHGHFSWNEEKNGYDFTSAGKPATAFLFKLISMLQFSGTVPMIDVQAYARWLSK